MKPALREAYMKVAEVFATLSRAKRRKVGAVIVRNGIIAEGYNGTPSGWNNSCEGPDGLTLPEVVHAEQNALDKLVRSGVASQGAVLFVTTAPCIDCAKRIQGAGINSVFYREVYRSDDGLKHLARAGISAIRMEAKGDQDG